jgi:hypothetical protein
MQPIPHYQTFKKSTAYIKVYPKFVRLFTYDSPISVQESGYEERSPHHTSGNFQDPMREFDSLRRTKTNLSDLTLCNDFDLFCTFTFSPKKVNNRADPNECKQKMHEWLKNQQKQHKKHSKKFKYLIVPEYHKDGQSLHFHALFHGYNGKLKNSGIKQKNKTVYNITSYRTGFSTAVKIDNIEKVSSYIKKYITKEMPRFEGKKRYWCSDKLVRPTKQHNPDIDPFTLAQFIHKYELKHLTISELATTVQTTIKQEGILQWPILLET